MSEVNFLAVAPFVVKIAVPFPARLVSVLWNVCKKWTTSLEDLMTSVKMTETIGIVVDEFDGLVESVDAQHAKHWSKNLLLVCLTEEVNDANDLIRWRIVKISRYICYFENWWQKPNRHVGFHFSDDWRAAEVAIWIAFHLVEMKENSTRCLKCEMNSNRCSPSVQQQLCSLIHSWLKATTSARPFWIGWQFHNFFNYLKQKDTNLNQPLNPGFWGRWNNWRNVCACLMARSHLWPKFDWDPMGLPNLQLMQCCQHLLGC